jgi:hypothetical protein
MKKWSCCLKGGVIVLVGLLLTCGCSAGNDPSAPFRDNFADPSSGWDTDQGEEFERGYDGGEYFIELSEPNWFTWAYPGKRFDDVIVEVDAYLASGSPDGHFGVFCRRADEDNFYYFAISADGYYAIFLREHGGDVQIITENREGMVFSPLIHTDGQVNNIQADCRGDELSLYVNGELLEAVSDDAISQGDVGLGAGSGPEGHARVQFDNFVVTQP